METRRKCRELKLPMIVLCQKSHNAKLESVRIPPAIGSAVVAIAVNRFDDGAIRFVPGREPMDSRSFGRLRLGQDDSSALYT